MALNPGDRVGPYEVLAALGAGGMGLVYKAVDTRLDRPVALKVISGGGWVEGRRFAREAKAASTLNHPNIVAIYEFDTQDGVDFIAMEYVAGTTLSRLLEERGAPLATLLEYARQAALGIAKAHEAGIVHRDLKPGNIMVTPEGVVKILDFGLAKLPGAARADVDATVTQALTNAGTSVGTPAYMAPEQAMGEPEDWRTDIFAFGIILYEIACGCRPFHGNTVHATLYQIAHEAPTAPRAVNPALPEALAELIKRCLRKKPAERPQSMAEVAAALAGLEDEPARKRNVRRRRFLLTAALGAGAVALPVAYWRSGDSRLTYSIEAQKMRDGQPVGQPYEAAVTDTYESGSKFRVRVRPSKAGFVYLVSQGPPLWVVYPLEAPRAPLPADRDMWTGWLVLDQRPGTERLWLVFTPERLPVLEEPLQPSTGHLTGRVESLDTASAIERLLAGFQDGKSASKVLGRLLELRHR